MQIRENQWPRSTQLCHTSFEVLVDDDPPCPFVSYVELTNSGGRILRGGGQAASFQNGWGERNKFLYNYYREIDKL